MGVEEWLTGLREGDVRWSAQTTSVRRPRIVTVTMKVINLRIRSLLSDRSEQQALTSVVEPIDGDEAASIADVFVASDRQFGSHPFGGCGRQGPAELPLRSTLENTCHILLCTMQRQRLDC